MSKHGKKYINADKNRVRGEVLSVDQALSKVKELAFAKFDESIDVHVNLGIDPTQGEQAVRGSLVLPFSKGAAPRVIVFAKGEHADEAKKAGADVIGTDDLVEKINGGWLEFDYAVATPDLMGMVGKLAKLLGPRGLLPNKKLGTVTFDVQEIVQDLKRGRLFFKNDKSGLVHFTIGSVSFDANKLRENFATFIKALASVKPSTSKGKFIKKVTIASTMGVGVQVNTDELLLA